MCEEYDAICLPASNMLGSSPFIVGEIYKIRDCGNGSPMCEVFHKGRWDSDWYKVRFKRIDTKQSILKELGVNI